MDLITLTMPEPRLNPDLRRERDGTEKTGNLGQVNTPDQPACTGSCPDSINWKRGKKPIRMTYYRTKRDCPPPAGIFTTILKPLKVGLCALTCVFFASCGGGAVKPLVEVNFDPDAFVANLDGFVSTFPESKALLAEQEMPKAQEFRLSVYVDQSQSIQAFVPSDATPSFYESSDFVDLLRGLANQAEVDSFFGFGSGGNSQSGEGEIRKDYGRTPPLNKTDYSLSNNDYSKLISEFRQNKEPNRVFMMITDGVQSHPNSDDGSLMGATADAIKGWLEEGGHVDLRVLKAPFQGKYFSEELRAKGNSYTLTVTEPNRPFLVCAFLPSRDYLDEWEQFLGRERMAGVSWAAAYQLPQFEEKEAPVLSPFPVELSLEESREMGLVPRTNKPYQEFKHLTDLDSPWSEHIWWAKINTNALRSENMEVVGTLPVYFKCAGYGSMNGGGFEFDQKSFNQWRPRLNIYRKVEVKPEDAAGGEGGAPNGGLEAEGEGDWSWVRVEERDLRFENPQVVMVSTPSAGSSKGESSTIPCLRYSIPFDGKNETLVIFSQKPLEATLDVPEFEFLSTFDDSSTDEMGKVYNLQTLMEQVTKDGKKIGRESGSALFLQPRFPPPVI